MEALRLVVPLLYAINVKQHTEKKTPITMRVMKMVSVREVNMKSLQLRMDIIKLKMQVIFSGLHSK